MDPTLSTRSPFHRRRGWRQAVRRHVRSHALKLLEPPRLLARSSAAPDLPGLVLNDPDVSSFDRQVYCLDWDGGNDVRYEGPVLVDRIAVPPIESPGGATARGFRNGLRPP